jgi:hypothetical protein
MLGNNKKSIGFNSNFYTNKSDFSPEALTWKANIINNGGTISDALLTIFDNNFFKPAKANGNILTELDRFNFYAGLVGFEIAARTNLIKSNHYVTPVSSPIFDNSGYRSGGTSYLNLNFIPSTQGIKFTQNNNIAGFVTKNPAFLNNYRGLGALDTITGNARYEVSRDLLRLTGWNNSFTQFFNTNIITTGFVFCATKRTAASGIGCEQLLINNNSITANTSSVGNIGITHYELCININGSPTGAFDIVNHACSWHGSANLDYINFMTYVQNTLIALGV